MSENELPDPIRLRRGGSASYEGELPPHAHLDREFQNLRERRAELDEHPTDEQLHDRHRAKLEHLEILVDELRLDPEIREAARVHLEPEREWSDAMPVQRRRALGHE